MRILKSIRIELTATGKRTFARRTMRVAALLLLFGLLAPPGALPRPAAIACDPSTLGVMDGDNPVFPPGNGHVPEPLSGLKGLPKVGRLAPGIYRGAQPKPEGYATLKGLGIRTVINLRIHHGGGKPSRRRGCDTSRSP